MYVMHAKGKCLFAGIVHAVFRFVMNALKKICGASVMVPLGFVPTVGELEAFNND